MALTTFLAGLCTYFILLSMGLGYSLYLTKHRTHSFAISLGLAPLISSSLAVVLGVWFIQYEFSLRHLQMASGVIAVVSALITFKYTRLFSDMNMRFLRPLIQATIVFIGISIYLMACWNNYNNGFFYHHLAPDTAIYASNAIFFLNGNTMTDVNLPYVSEIIFNAHRWGFPYLTTLITSLTPYANVYMIMQLMTFILLACSAWTITWILFETSTLTSKDRNRHYYTIAFVALCITANAALIYYLSEGFYPQIMTAALLNVILALLYEGKEQTSTAIIVTLLSAALVAIYSESYALLILLLLASIMLNSCFLNRKNIRTDILFFACAITSLLLVQPLSSVIIAFIINNSSNFNSIGYPQPGWMLPSDIVGLSNIFTPFSAYLDDQVSVHLVKHPRNFIYIILSTWVSFEFINLLRKLPVRHSLRVATLLLSGLGIFVINYALIHFSGYSAVNYMFDKLITNIAPILTGLFFLALLTPHSHHPFKFEKLRHLKFIFALVLTYLSIHGLTKDHKHFLEYVDIISAQQIADSGITDNYEILFNKRGYRRGEVIGKLRYIDVASESIFGATLQRQPVDQWVTKTLWSCFSPKKEVAIIVRKSDLLDAQSYLHTHQKDVLIDTKTYVVLRTHRKLSSMINGDNSYQEYKKHFAL